MVSTPLKNISQLGLLFPIYGKIKNVPNHQPASVARLDAGACWGQKRSCCTMTSWISPLKLWQLWMQLLSRTNTSTVELTLSAPFITMFHYIQLLPCHHHWNQQEKPTLFETSKLKGCRWASLSRQSSYNLSAQDSVQSGRAWKRSRSAHPPWSQSLFKSLRWNDERNGMQIYSD